MFLSFSSFNIFSVHPFCYSTAGRQIRRCFGRCFVLLVLRAEGVEGGISINAANGKMFPTRKTKSCLYGFNIYIYIYTHIYIHYIYIYIHIYIVYIYMGYSGLYMRSVTYSSCFFLMVFCISLRLRSFLPCTLTDWNLWCSSLWS